MQSREHYAPYKRLGVARVWASRRSLFKYAFGDPVPERAFRNRLVFILWQKFFLCFIGLREQFFECHN